MHEVVRDAVQGTIDDITRIDILTVSMQFYLLKLKNNKVENDLLDADIVRECISKITYYLINGANIDCFIDNYQMYMTGTEIIVTLGDYDFVYEQLFLLYDYINTKDNMDIVKGTIITQLANSLSLLGKASDAIAFLKIGGLLYNSDCTKNQYNDYLKYVVVYTKCLNKLGEYTEAISKLETIENYSDPVNYDREEVLWEAKQEYATALFFLERYDEALLLANTIYSHFLQVLGENTVKTIISASFLASCLNACESYDEAKTLHLKTIELKTKKFGKLHPETGSSYNNLGYTYYCNGEYNLALSNLNTALDIRKKVLPAYHPAVARTINNIGIVLFAMNEIEKALERCICAYNLRKKIYEEDHPEIANSLYYLALIYERKGMVLTSADYLIKSLNIRKNKLDSKARDLYLTYQTLVSLLEKYSLKDCRTFHSIYLECVKNISRQEK